MMEEDYNRQAHLEQFGTQRTCNETLKYFVAEVPEHLAALLGYINAKQYGKAICNIKTIKEAAKLIGAMPLAHVAADIEHTLNNDPEIHNETIDKVTTLCCILLEKNDIIKHVAKNFLVHC